MSVYVDTMVPCTYSKRWPYKSACHMIADSVEELKIVANHIGLKPEWFQPLSFPHFDLTESKRKQAILYGAVSLSLQDMGKKIRELRKYF